MVNRATRHQRFCHACPPTTSRLERGTPLTQSRGRCSISRLLIAVVVACGSRHPVAAGSFEIQACFLCFLLSDYETAIFFRVTMHRPRATQLQFTSRDEKLPCVAWRTTSPCLCGGPLTTGFLCQETQKTTLFSPKPGMFFL